MSHSSMKKTLKYNTELKRETKTSAENETIRK